MRRIHKSNLKEVFLLLLFTLTTIFCDQFDPKYVAIVPDNVMIKKSLRNLII